MNLSVKENSKNYACSVVEIKDLFPIEGADKIQRCLIFGNDIVCSKDVKVGDKMLYFVSGTKLNEDYCKFNNLLDNAELNRDPSVKGFISHKQFRCKAIKLRGVISNGMLMPLKSLWGVKDVNLVELNIGDEFTTLDGIDVCEKYIVPVRNSNPGGKSPKQPKKIDRLIDGQFFLHGDTDNLRKNIHKVSPYDIIGLHYKKHGTSVVIGNVLVKRQLKWYERLAAKFVDVTDTQYDIVYSSRKVVKNQYLNPDTGAGFYGEDIWGVVAKEIGHLIPKGWTLYGEILGYTPTNSAIQGKYDYGCNVGEHKFYVYKISIVDQDGSVIYLTDKQIEEYCDKVGILYRDTFIYYGRAIDRFNYIDEKEWNVETWRKKFLEVLESTHNEKDCYMCVNKVPEEGIILRVESLFNYEAYKLKSKRFILMESDEQEVGSGNIEDVEA